MTGTPKVRPTRRLTREDWIASARKTLVERGVDDVKVDRLAKQMRVTRGSFYWHFKHRRDLMEALLTDWEARNYFEIAQIRARWAKTAPDLTEVVASWLEADPAFPSFDVAVRAWARKSTDVAEAVERADTAWIALLQELFEKSGYDSDESLVRARITHFHQIGYYALGFREPQAERLRLVPLYYRVLTGREATANLLKKLDELVREAPAAKRGGRKAAG
ncbi:TetR/AcrR family transcriptional regulator [uncultured Sphingosinicella sp.]|jgi:AcrR family transcriptional regulator|uniref:TetR/AcrR family transcriptional regulator n=1 Tax=uncultured Sphingosinicella sp. TaxID=478748 RepID=UPI0030DB5186|tara:strand:+ start:33946 stop:34605 length:660 start_codon:yes stop_codon:yes gene_type:complete